MNHERGKLSVLGPFILACLLLSACQPTPTPTLPSTHTPTLTPTFPPTPTSLSPSPSEDVIHLAIIWHQHQPVYYKDPETGVYAKPWVRVHASKDYYDMAAILKSYPDVHVTFNLTPSLIRQLDDLAAGATDVYWEMASVPADQLTDEQKRFILRYFFDINPEIVQRFLTYTELQRMRPSAGDDDVQVALETWTAQDYRDLQVLFNLGWTDPDFLGQEPLASLVAKGRGYTEEDKAVVLGEHLRILKDVIPLHREMQESGQIEVTMTPFAHPILPLLINTSLAKVALPTAEMPDPPFRFGQDAEAQLARGVAMYRDHFGVDPSGMWPAEGAVAQQMVHMVSGAGIRWMASDEGVLAQSLWMGGFSRDAGDVVQEADALYRPYAVAGPDDVPVAIVFRDVVLSDKVGFAYSRMDGQAAAADLIGRIHAIRQRLKAEGAQGPHLVTVILDGENAWEHYENDGKEFLHTLYRLLSDDPAIVTVTPSEYLARFPAEPSRQIDDLWPGSWINHDYATWIGEEEENRAWEYLQRARHTLGQYADGTFAPPSDEALEEAFTLMYIAEGSDWFWWYGADQNSGADDDFDRQYRDTLKQVFTTLGKEPPAWLSVPIVAQAPEPAERATAGLIQPTIDGVPAAGEWDAAGYYGAGGGAMAAGGLPLDRLYYGFDAQHLYLRVEGAHPWASLTTGQSSDMRTVVGIYILPPGDDGPSSAFSRYSKPGTSYLGFGARHLLQIYFAANATITGGTFTTFDGEKWGPAAFFPIEDLRLVADGTTLEMVLPLGMLSGTGAVLDSGARVQMRLVFSQGEGEALEDKMLLPVRGPAQVTVPDLGLTTAVLEIADPEGDDHGPGSYVYPTDGVFKPGVFDATSFRVSYDDANVVFQLTLRGPLENVWESPNGVSLQALDIYVDKDGPGNGQRLLLPGRNAALAAAYAWDYAIWVEGWTPGVFVPGDEGPVQVDDAQMAVIPDPGQGKITVKVPRAVLGDDPESWAYAAVVTSQDGYPSAGVWRVRDVNPSAQQYRLGGGPDDENHTRIIDVLWPADAAPTQEEMLSTYVPSQQSPGGLGPDDFAQLEMLRP
jgi:alpha-amylase/alpha-mannosidase (GH57 family)